MKDTSACLVDGHNCCPEYEDDLMECGDFLDLVGLTKEMENGEVDIYKMAERIANLLGRSESLVTSSDDDDDRLSCDEDDDDDDDEDEESNDVELVTDNTRVAWTDNNPDAHDRNLLLAGYTNCMDEAIRYLVEEEQYSIEHPVVQGLKQHLVSQQERVLVEAARGTNLNNQTDARLVQRVDTLCTLRPAPSI